MNSQEKKNYLSQYIPLKRELQRSIEELKRWKDISVSLEKESPDLQTAVANIGQIENRITRQTKKLKTVTAEIEKAIMSLEDPTLRLIMQRRYIDGRRFHQIARELNYSCRHVERLHGTALLKINIKDVVSCRN